MLKKPFNSLKVKFASVTAATLILIGITEQSAKSAVLALSDDNSVAAFESSFSDNPANNGLIFWTVDNINHLFHNQFWYRIGSTSKENDINTLNLIGINQTEPGSNQLSATYAGTGFEIALNFKLDGDAPNSGRSSLLENIEIKNTGLEQLDFHFFNYTDFDLTENGEDDTVKISRDLATQFDSFTVATEVIKPSANYYQVSPFPDILNALTDNFPTTLSNFAGPLTDENAYAFQWDFVLEPQKSFSIKNYKSIKPVPEPTMILGCLISLVSLGMLRRSPSIHLLRK
ncbi:hypothetical protein NIES4103_23930 [Nostoc sp. NIES-4103]|nr:hypothetical protein NIES4103_23930 [Nostoc sp. NIES-4103]